MGTSFPSGGHENVLELDGGDVEVAECCECAKGS